VILLLHRGVTVITVDDITAALDIPKSTAYRYVKILTDKGFLARGTVAGTYRLGRVFLELGGAVLASNRDIHLAAMPSMLALSEQTGESVSIMRLMNRRAVCIESIEGRYALRVAIGRGHSQPLHAGASSRLLLAYTPETSWESYIDLPLARYTTTTLTDIDALFANLHAVKQRGFAVSDGEIDVGARAVAVPLWDSYERVVAALSIEAPASRLPDDVLQDYITALQEAAQTISAALT
jgi:DNA-binding IclR family transcriptional regulator